ncbi:WxL domain-containing protein [Enterococcus faecium]|uniref:WxL domain-containing protein n=1 Tax=Enterococcus faecium TaxID=1352 RepID=UPI000BF0512F|nr:WxL domain-containing protein [Enterococcus faecium]PEH49554.1 hypothetical protein CRM75_02005 [Enterococcus faecium]
MKKTIFAAVFISTTLLAGASIVHADDQNGTSIARIGLAQQDPDNPVGPIDPITPDDGDDNSNDPTGNTGALRIDYISNIDFGSQTISGKTETYHAQAPATMTEAQVSDLRGTGAGWNLQVSYDAETTGFKDGKKILNGAELTLPAGTPIATAGNQSQAPSANSVTVNDSAQNIMTAASSTGLGTWADKMTTANVNLKVPSGNLTGNYTATLVWTLTDAPA